MKETNVKRLHTAWFQLHDSWKKQNYRNSKKTNGCLGLGGDGQREGWTEHREVLLLWNCFVWPYRGGCCCLVTQTCAILCDLTDCSLPGSSVYGIFQARMVEWVASTKACNHFLFCTSQYSLRVLPFFCSYSLPSIMESVRITHGKLGLRLCYETDLNLSLQSPSLAL